jgi:hypothetical protein
MKDEMVMNEWDGISNGRKKVRIERENIREK